jgi:hypothetical protein
MNIQDTRRRKDQAYSARYQTNAERWIDPRFGKPFHVQDSLVLTDKPGYRLLAAAIIRSRMPPSGRLPRVAKSITNR